MVLSAAQHAPAAAGLHFCFKKHPYFGLDPDFSQLTATSFRRAAAAEAE